MYFSEFLLSVKFSIEFEFVQIEVDVNETKKQYKIK